MPITSAQYGWLGIVDTSPGVLFLNTNDTIATVTTTVGNGGYSYLNQMIQSNLLTIPGNSSNTNGSVAIVNTSDAGPALLSLQVSAGKVYSLVSNPIPGGSFSAPATFAGSTSSATPGTIRALLATMTANASVLTNTSSSLAAVRGALTAVGASSGYLYGVQGKIISTGTLSGSSWTAGVFGQLDISAATINSGQIAPIWGDYGATSGTISDATGMYGIAMTNSTAAVLNAQIYLFGGATSLFEISTNSGGVGQTYVQPATSGALSGTIKKLAITIDSVTYYIPCATAVA